MLASASMNSSADTGDARTPNIKGPLNSTNADRKYHIQLAEMWLEIVGLFVLICVMFAVGFHLF